MELMPHGFLIAYLPFGFGIDQALQCIEHIGKVMRKMVGDGGSAEKDEKKRDREGWLPIAYDAF